VRDHGGDLDAAVARFGGMPADWLDLSTGINREPWPLPAPPAAALRSLPGRAQLEACAAAARAAYGAVRDLPCLPVAGAQAAIQLVPRLGPAGRVGVLGPTYNEHAAAFVAAGWEVAQVAGLPDLGGFDAAVLVNPNNPDGRRWPPETVLALAGRNGLVVVDESFADPEPGLSVCPALRPDGRVLALRSFGKFYGLAGLRLGFVLGAATEVAALADAAGPWSVSGPALDAGTPALADAAWAETTRTRLAVDARRLDYLAGTAGWRVVGGTSLFRLYDTPNAAAAQEQLARARVWSRIFPYSASWLRLGLPGPGSEWDRLAAALD
jgi:cobalamin biosynthetic protein CobC